MGCFVRGGKNGMGCFVRGDKNCMGCFVQGGKLMRDVLSGVAKNGMGCFVPGCFVLHSCQHIMKTPARLLTGHGKSGKANVCGNFLKEKCGLGKKVILSSDFKTISFEKIILWEKAARKLDSSPVCIESPCC